MLVYILTFIRSYFQDGSFNNSLTDTVDFEAVQSLLAMSQWSPPSPPNGEMRTKAEVTSDEGGSVTSNDEISNEKCRLKEDTQQEGLVRKTFLSLGIVS